VAHYLKNAVSLESKDDEKRRESMISDHAHQNDHGGKQAEAEFWEKHHAKDGVHGHGEAHEARAAASMAHGKDGKVPGDVTGSLM
jgi:hypothetical protein